MALQKTVKTKFGFEAVNAYHKIGSISVNDKTTISFILESKIDASNEPFEVESFSCNYDLNGNNPIAQAYAHLKTLPEFENATDC